MTIPTSKVAMHVPNAEPLVIDSGTTRTLYMMIATGLVRYEPVVRWADELVMATEAPEVWQVELCASQDARGAMRALAAATWSPSSTSSNASSSDVDAGAHEHIACLFLRHVRGDLTWAEFLDRGGQILDSANGRLDCSFLFSKLNALEDSRGSREVEAAQRAEVQRTFEPSLARVERWRSLLASFAP